MTELVTAPSGTDKYRIAVDTGGTFTDVVVGSSRGTVAVGKALTTYDRVFTGFEASVRRATESAGLTAEDVSVSGRGHRVWNDPRHQRGADWQGREDRAAGDRWVCRHAPAAGGRSSGGV